MTKKPVSRQTEEFTQRAGFPQRDDAQARPPRPSASARGASGYRGPVGLPSYAPAPLTDAEHHDILTASVLSSDFLLLAHELASIGSYVHNQRTGVLHLSREMARLVGIGDTPMQMPFEKYLREFCRSANGEPTPDAEARGCAPGDARWHDARIIRPDGREIWVRTASMSRTNHAGEPVRVGMLHDITEQRLAREAERAAAELLRRSLFNTIQALSATLESRDPYTAGHQRRVAQLAAAVARELGMPADRVEGIHFGALLHDIGKIQLPAELLAKPTRLEKYEFELIKAHPEVGYNIVRGIDFPWPIADMIRQHHERLDGTGYPHGLGGDAILIEARILSVADVVEAMASHRPYRPGRGIDVALAEIEAHSGRLYDAEVVRACTGLFREKSFRFEN